MLHLHLLFSLLNIFCIAFNSERNKLKIWDDFKRQFVAEIECESKIINVKLNGLHLGISLLQTLSIYEISTLKVLKNYDTDLNDDGLFEMRGTTIFTLGKWIGLISIDNVSSKQTPVSINAHQNGLKCIAVNEDNTLLATASDQGTLINVWDMKGNHLKTFRRGRFTCTIHSLSFYKNYLACLSINNTIHIFNIHGDSLFNTVDRSIMQLKVESASRCEFIKEFLYIFKGNEIIVYRINKELILVKKYFLK